MKTTVCLMFACLTFASAAIFRHLDEQTQVDPNAPLTPDPNIPAPLNPQPLPSKLQFLQRILNGLSEEAGIQPTPIVNGCLDENSADEYLKSINDVLDDVSKGDWIELPETIDEMKETISDGIQICLANDAGMKGIWDAYGITGLGLAGLYVKFATYAIGGNYDTLMQNLTDIYSVYQRGQYEIVGRMSGQLIKTVVAYDPNANPPNPETAPPPPPGLTKMYNDGWNYDSHYDSNYDGHYDNNDYHGNNYDHDYNGDHH